MSRGGSGAACQAKPGSEPPGPCQDAAMSASSPTLPPDDRRNLSLRLSGMQAVVATLVCRAGGGVLGLPGRPAPEVRRDGGEQPPPSAAAAGAARRAVRPQRQGARREPEHLQHRARPRAVGQHRRHAAPGCRGHRRRRSDDARDGEPAPSRAELPADRAGRERDAWSRSSRSRRAAWSCPASSRRKCRRASIPRARSGRICSAT